MALAFNLGFDESRLGSGQHIILSPVRLVESWWWVRVWLEFVFALPGHPLWQITKIFDMSVILAWGRCTLEILEVVLPAFFHDSGGWAFMFGLALHWVVKARWWIRIRDKLVFTLPSHFLRNGTKWLVWFVFSTTWSDFWF